MNLLRFLSCLGFLSIVALFFVAAATEAAPPEDVTRHNLIPAPARISFGANKLVIDESFRVVLAGYTEPRLRAAVERMILRLSKQTGIPIIPRIEPDPARARLEIRCNAAGESVQTVNENESYRLEVTQERARLSAPSPAGVLRGM